METVLTTSNEYEASVKRIPFDGKQENWRQWKNRAITYAAVKGFRGALARDLGNLITEEEYENSLLGISITTASGATDEPSTAATAVRTTAVSAQERKLYKMNLDAFNFLMLSCEGIAFGFVETQMSGTEGNAHLAWMALLRRYESNDIGSDYVSINKGFSDCKLNGLVGDPDLWFQDLEYWNH